MDPYKRLKIIRNPDGSLTRIPFLPIISTTDEDFQSTDVLCKEIPLNTTTNTSLRIFLPKQHTTTTTNVRLPILLEFHGGGFILYSAASAPFHNTCRRISSHVPAIVVSVDYRLAPEHRLPAAYDDALESLLWLRDHVDTDDWLSLHADPTRCFLLGGSSGGNVAYHLGLLALQQQDLKKLSAIRGLILNQPFFGGKERTESETRMGAEDMIVPLAVSDLMWELALPEGADRDHEYCNVVLAAGKKGNSGKGLPPCMVRGLVGDPLIDRQREFARMLEAEGVRVVGKLDEEGLHGNELFDESKMEALLDDIKSFVCGRLITGGDAAAAAEDMTRNRL